MQKFISNKKIGRIYSCRIFYGNGTAIDFRKSFWRDNGLGVITDLGSHLLDLCIFFFGKKINDIQIIDVSKFENASPDNAIIKLRIGQIKINLEVSLCCWRNSFTCDFYGSNGSLHIKDLSKWGKSHFIFRKRKKNLQEFQRKFRI